MMKLDVKTSLNMRKSFKILAVIHAARIQNTAANEDHLAQDDLSDILILMTFD